MIWWTTVVLGALCGLGAGAIDAVVNTYGRDPGALPNLQPNMVVCLPRLYGDPCDSCQRGEHTLRGATRIDASLCTDIWHILCRV